MRATNNPNINPPWQQQNQEKQHFKMSVNPGEKLVFSELADTARTNKMISMV